MKNSSENQSTKRKNRDAIASHERPLIGRTLPQIESTGCPFRDLEAKYKLALALRNKQNGTTKPYEK